MELVVNESKMSISQRIQADQALTVGARDRVASLFDSYFDAVYRFCLSRSADRTIAEDAASQTFVEAARTLAADPTASIDEAWLIVTARRRLIDGWRRQGRQLRLKERALLAAGVSRSGEPCDVTSERAMRALSSLPERQRGAIALRYLDDYSVAEVADLLEMSYQAAESLLARARRSFEKAWLSIGEVDE